MWESVRETYHYYASFYAKYLQTTWSNMTPIKYGILLVAIGLFGWILMKSSVKKC